MDITLIASGNTSSFVFPALPEQISVRNTARYQSFDVISLGSVKVPKGMDIEEISWDGEFFGDKKQHEAIVRPDHYRKPIECVKILKDYMSNGTVLNLIVSDSFINQDVTISSFQATAYGAWGNIKYSISLEQRRTLEIYDTTEMNIAAFVPTIPRNGGNDSAGAGLGSGAGGNYTVKKGDTLWRIAKQHYGNPLKWPTIYDANAAVIKATAKRYRKRNSDHGHWIYPGTVLTIPAI